MIIQVEYIAYQALVLAIRETMSWWDTSQLTSFATNALKNAQKKIDKVLDIPTEDDDSTSNSNRFSSKFKFSITFKASICYLFNSSVSNSLAVRESLCEKAVLLVEGKMIALNFVLSHNRFRFTCDTSIPYFSLFWPFISPPTLFSLKLHFQREQVLNQRKIRHLLVGLLGAQTLSWPPSPVLEKRKRKKSKINLYLQIVRLKPFLCM